MTSTLRDVPLWRLEMAIAELRQAVEFHAGQRDDTFPGCPAADLPGRRSGAIDGCVRTALGWLTNQSVTLKQRRIEHEIGACDELCPACCPKEWE